MKNQVILLTGPQGGGKSYTIQRIKNAGIDCNIRSEVATIDELDNVLMDEHPFKKTVVIETSIDRFELLRLFSDQNIRIVFCDYSKGRIPSLYNLFY